MFKHISINVHLYSLKFSWSSYLPLFVSDHKAVQYHSRIMLKWILVSTIYINFKKKCPTVTSVWWDSGCRLTVHLIEVFSQEKAVVTVHLLPLFTCLVYIALNFKSLLLHKFEKLSLYSSMLSTLKSNQPSYHGYIS